MIFATILKLNPLTLHFEHLMYLQKEKAFLEGHIEAADYAHLGLTLRMKIFEVEHYTRVLRKDD